VFVKLPIAFIRQPDGRPRVWPLIDAILAFGNAVGFWQGSKMRPTSNTNASLATHHG
jgi:hypothetical protein